MLTGLVIVFLAEFVVGVVQLIGALIRTIYRLSAGLPLGKLKLYWLLVLVFFIVLAGIFLTGTYCTSGDSLWYNNSDSLWDAGEYQPSYINWTRIIETTAIIWIGLAWGIAIWYWVAIVFKSKPKENPDVQL